MNKRNVRMMNNRGFTLVEILTVLGVIGVLGAALAIGGPKVMSIARVSTAQNDIKQMTTAVNDAATKLGGTLPLTEFVTGATIGTAQSGFNVTGATLQGSSGANFSATARLDQVIMGVPQPLLESYFRPSLGSQNFARADSATTGELVWDGAGMTISNGNLAIGATASYTGVTRLECAPVDAAATPGTPSATGVNFRLNGTSSLPAGRVAYIVYQAVPGVEAYNLALKVNGNALVTDTSAAGTVAQTSGKVTYAAGTGTNTVYVYLGNF